MDDGSTDNSGTILDEFSHSDSRFSVIHKPNEGVSIARNVAVQQVRGKFVTFLDADDLVAPDWLANYKYVFDSSNVDMVRIQLERFQDGALIPACSASMGFHVVDKDKFEYYQLISDTRCHGYVCLCAYKASTLKSCKFPAHVGFAEDAIFNFSYLDSCGDIAISKYSGYLYRQRHCSGSHRVLENEEWLQFCDAILGMLMHIKSPIICEQASFMLWGDLAVFLSDAKSMPFRRDIRKRINMARQHLKFLFSGMKVHWRISCALFLALGIIWPTIVLKKVLSVKS